jgi:ATP-dependent Clp protease ATP-binding subunit ClpA
MPRDGKQGGSSSQDPLDRLSNFAVLADKWDAKSRDLAVIDPAELSSYLKSKVIGQNAVIDSVVMRLHRRMAAKRPNKPIAVFCFAGAPGVGKTYLAQILAEKIYGSPKNLHYIDMTKFGSEATSWTLFGSASGHVGSNKPGLLPRYLRDVPNSVVLLDEIEKAHRSILTQFLSAWNDGFITEMSDGSKHSTADAIFIMTTNAGRSRINEYTRDPKITQEELNKLARGALQDAQFAPEVLSRVDDVFAFRELAGLDIARVVALEIEKAAKSYSLDVGGQGIDPEILMQAIEEFTENKPSGGVREIARHIEDKIADGLIDARAGGATHVMFEADGSDVRVIPVAAPSDAVKADTASVRASNETGD